MRLFPVAVAAAPALRGVACTTTKGAVVAVDFAHWSAPIARGCDAALTKTTTGLNLLHAAEFTTTGVAWFPAFVCRIGSPLVNSGTQYPTTAQDPCGNVPP